MYLVKTINVSLFENQEVHLLYHERDSTCLIVRFFLKKKGEQIFLTKAREPVERNQPHANKGPDT